MGRAFKAISRVANMEKTEPHLEVLRDPPDNRILECAAKGEADLIVSGGPHLLTRRRFGGAGIAKRRVHAVSARRPLHAAGWGSLRLILPSLDFHVLGSD